MIQRPKGQLPAPRGAKKKLENQSKREKNWTQVRKGKKNGLKETYLVLPPNGLSTCLVDSHEEGLGKISKRKKCNLGSHIE